MEFSRRGIAMQTAGMAERLLIEYSVREAYGTRAKRAEEANGRRNGRRAELREAQENTIWATPRQASR